MQDATLEVALKIGSRALGTISSGEHIDAGFSRDLKFRLQDREGGEFLLRLSAADEVDQRRFEFDSISALRRAGVLCPSAISFGIEGELCYGLYSYVPGECASDVLPGLPPERQSAIGRDAGIQLRLLHSTLSAPCPVDDYTVRSTKFGKFVRNMSDYGLCFSGQERVEEFARANLTILKGRPTTFRHGDFHPGNLIVGESGLAGVIDFNRCDWGDPVDDFYKTAFFGAPVSAPFANGMIRSYFDGEAPREFWRLYNTYVACTIHADICWTHLLFPGRLQEALARAESIVKSHDFETGDAPNWAE